MLCQTTRLFRLSLAAALEKEAKEPSCLAEHRTLVHHRREDGARPLPGVAYLCNAGLLPSTAKAGILLGDPPFPVRYATSRRPRRLRLPLPPVARRTAGRLSRRNDNERCRASRAIPDSPEKRR